MEGGELSLEEALAAHKRGLELARFCQQKLEAAQQQVKVLEGEVLKPLADAAPAGGDADEDRSRVISRPGWATSRRAWRAALARLLPAGARGAGAPARGDALCRARRRQARAAAARVRRRRSGRRATPSALERRGLRGRADPRLFAGARRHAVHGRRRAAPRQAHRARASSTRRRRCWPATRCRRWPSSCSPSTASPTMPRAQLDMVQLLARRRRLARHGGRPGDRPRRRSARR